MPDRDDDRAVEQMRQWMTSHDLLPPVPRGPAEPAEVLRKITSSTPGPQHPARYLLGAAAVVLVALVVVAQAVWTAPPTTAAGAPAMLTYSDGDPHRLADAPGGTTALLGAAATAARAEPAPGTGPIQHVTSYGWLKSSTDDDPLQLVPTMTSSWLMPDGSARIAQQRSRPLHDDGTLETSPPGGTSAVDDLPAGAHDPSLAQSLPRDPATVVSAVQEAFSGAGANCTESTVCQVAALKALWATYVVPPDLAAAIWEALANDQSMHSLGATVDRLGRPVLAVAYAPDARSVEVLLISAETGQLSGTESISLDPDVVDEPPAVTSFTALTDTRWVDEVPSR